MNTILFDNYLKLLAKLTVHPYKSLYETVKYKTEKKRLEHSGRYRACVRKNYFKTKTWLTLGNAMVSKFR